MNTNYKQKKKNRALVKCPNLSINGDGSKKSILFYSILQNLFKYQANS